VKRSSVGHFNCSIARSLDVVGEWWTLLVLRDVFMGVRRFEAIQADLGIARNVLSDRLSTLVEHGVLDKRRYQEHPDRYEYVLTDMGRELAPVLAALMRWGDRWLSPDGPPMQMLHRDCSEPLEWGGTCPHCGVDVGPRDVRIVKGPGWREPVTPATATSAAGTPPSVA
jgi:DNA-binding HxlR family transcriptional regulator